MYKRDRIVTRGYLCPDQEIQDCGHNLRVQRTQLDHVAQLSLAAEHRQRSRDRCRRGGHAVDTGQ